MAKWMNDFLFGGAGTSTKLGDVGLAILRVGTGLFIAFGHGQAKVWGPDRFGPPEVFVEGVEALGFPAPLLFAWMAAAAEFLGGILVAIGLLTRPMALVLAGNMLVAAFVRHIDDPLFGAPPSKELALLYLLPFILFVCTGGGRISVDAALRKS